MNYVRIPTGQMIHKLDRPEGNIRCVLDTDAFNEVDDQFAIAHALLSGDTFRVESVYAAPFHNARSSGPADGMEQSYSEIHRVLDALEWQDRPPVLKGAARFLERSDAPVDSAAVRDLIRRAMSGEPDEPLYVLAIGAITNIASAILMEPRIVERIVVIWLGGHALHWPHVKEFNLRQDPLAARTVLDCGVPLILVPCLGVASHLSTTLAELERHLRDCGPIGAFLIDNLVKYANDETAYSKVIWDIAVTGYFTRPDAIVSELVHSPILTDRMTWSVDASRHFIRYVSYVDRNLIFGDLFDKLKQRAAKSTR